MSSREVSLLLVDDDPSAIQVMGKMLSQYPDQRFATSGAVALRLARENTPDLILLDVDMPGMTGFDVCEALKADPVLAQVPIIFATSHDTALLQVTAWQKGAADFITKPLVASQLTARVQAHLRARPLPQQAIAERTAASPAPLAPGERPPRLLIVDDDVASIHILRRALDSMGDFHFAKTGEEALKLARRLIPDLILLDVHMPGLDGFDVCATFKADALFAHVPIVFVTRFSDPMNEKRALDLGAADFIAKPYTRAVLQARVRNVLDLKRRTDAELRIAHEQGRQVGEGMQRLTTAMLRDAGDRERLEAESRSRIAAEAASRTKALLMTYIAHEMGNPLTGLLGFARLMEADAGHPLPAPQAERLEHIVSSCRDLQSLMRDVMDLGRFETDKLTVELRPLDAARSVHAAIAAVSGLAVQAGVSLTCQSGSPLVFAVADAGRLQQCLVNLLTNAIKYSRPGGSTRVELQGDAQQVSIGVRDDGLGLSEQQRLHLFEPFNRLGRQEARAPGAGLGLVITRQLVEAMKGRLLVESEPGTGSCFTIVLPAAPSPSPQQRSQAADKH